MQAPPDAPLARLLPPAVLTANPFMAALTVRGLLARAAREIAIDAGSVAGPDGVTPGKIRRGTSVAVACNLSLPSCRRWLALRQGRTTVAQRAAKR